MMVYYDADLFQQVTQRVLPQGRLRRIWPLDGGMSAAMTALEIEVPDGKTHRMIVRQPNQVSLQNKPDAAEHEFQVLQLTQSLGLATPTPYYMDRESTLLPTPYLVINYVEGRQEFAPADLSCFITQLAVCLAQIHNADLTDYDLSFLPHLENWCEELNTHWVTHLCSFSEAERLRTTLRSVWPPTQSNASVLLHGDYWPGNTLWREGKLVAVIDWEDAQLGDPLSDLAISRLEVAILFGIEAMHLYTDHYQSVVDIDYTNLPSWDLCAALRIARLVGNGLSKWCSFFQTVGRPDVTEQLFTNRFNHFTGLVTEQLVQ